jgi:hypothetical protein
MGTTLDDPEDLPPDLVGYYSHLLGGVGATGAGGVESPGVFESTDGQPDLSEGGIRDRVEAARSELGRIVREHLGDKPELYEIVDRIVGQGVEALRILGSGDEGRLREDGTLRAGLEAIVRTDGSRPSFMVRNGEVDRTTSPVGDWSGLLDDSADGLRDALSCVGRIDVPEEVQGFAGTGFLVQENLILTNRHVLQVAASRGDDGTWAFKPGTAIDFGHEFRARGSVGRRELRRVVFSGSRPIDLTGPVDHTKLDLALIELEPAAAGERPSFLSLDVAPDWARPDAVVFAFGYPGQPVFGAYPFTLLESLFQSTFGCKRLAPGLVIEPRMAVRPWTLAHDGTTLGGSSGSLVVVAGRERVAAGLHYGGRSTEPRENWGHILGGVLAETDGAAATTLREHLKDHGVDLVDRTST